MLRKIKEKKHLFLIILSAVLLILAYPGFNFEFLAWIALIPLFFSLEEKSPKEKFVTGYIFGIIFFSGILYWLLNITVPGTIVLILILSIFPGIFCFFYRVNNALFSSIFISSAWVLSEYFRAHFLTGFPWALLGHSQSFNPSVIQIADITGAYGVSFLVVLANFGIYLTLKRHPKRFYTLFFILILFVSVVGYGQTRIRGAYPVQELKISVIQGNISQELKWHPNYRNYIVDKYSKLTKETFPQKPTLIIWPETSVPGYLDGEIDLEKKVTELAREANAYILAGTLREENGHYYNSATLVSNEGKLLESYDKMHLVPFGEFIPLEKKFPWFRKFIDKPMGDFDRGESPTVFKFRIKKSITSENKIQKITEFFKFSTLICFEDIFPDISRNSVKRGARFLVNITNDAWFGKTSAPFQHMQGSIFRAIENRVPVIRAANTGISCVIDHRGKILNIVKKGNKEIFVDGHITATISAIFSKSIYTRYGDVFSWICIIIVLGGTILRRFKPNWLLIFTILTLLTGPSYAKDEIYYRGKLDFTIPYIKRHDYVVRVIDGDTIVLRKLGKVRLVGIDTPESIDSRKLDRDAKRTKNDKDTIKAMGLKATAFTKKLVEGKKVRIEFDVEKKDRYNRWLAYIYLEDGRMLNAELVKEGYAQIYTFPPNVKHTDMLTKLQKEARENGKGFWKEEVN